MKYHLFYPVSGYVESFETLEEAKKYVKEDMEEAYNDYLINNEEDDHYSFDAFEEHMFGDVNIYSDKEVEELNIAPPTLKINQK